LCSFFIISKAQISISKNPAIYSPAKTSNLFLTPPSQYSINLKIKPFIHEAFFCKMEDKLHARLNVWVKLRAGNDEMYRMMIAEPNNPFN